MAAVIEHRVLVLKVLKEVMTYSSIVASWLPGNCLFSNDNFRAAWARGQFTGPLTLKSRNFQISIFFRFNC